MPYIGNTIRAADDYRLIDDISSGFNGSTTSFALQVAGSAPVPFPKSPQQVLISVNGVIQEPDPTGASGFNLVGTNIVFSSAPTNGHAFFGIIYATADYLNAGGNFPSGSLGAPSITFIGDENSGLYRKSGGSVGFVSDATEIANFDSNGITISSGSLIIPDSIIHNGDTNTKIRFSGADTVSVETAGTQRLEVASDGKINFGSVARVEADGVFKAAHGDASTPSYNFLNDNDNGMFRVTTNTIGFSTAGTERLRVDSSGNVGIGETSPAANLHVKEGDSGTTPDSNRDTLFIENNGNSGLTIGTPNSNSAYVAFADPEDDNAGQIIYRHASNSMSFFTAGSEVIRIDSSGRLLIGTTTEGHSNADDLTVNNSANCGITIRSGSSSDGNIFFSDATSGNGETKGVIKYKHADDALVFNSNGNERFRLDSSGRFLLGHNSDIGYGFRSQLVGTDGNTSSQAQIRFTNSASGPTFILAKSRNGTPGSKTIVNNNDNLGEIQFRGDDGVDYFGIAASIKTQIDGTPGAGDLPGRLVFSTTADGSDSATERMRISQSGDIAVNFDGSSQTGVFQIADGSASAPGLTFWADGAKDTGIFRSGANTLNLSTAGSERMRIDADGDVLVGLTSALSTQAGSIQAAGPIIAKSYINAHTSNAAVLQYISNKAVLRAYGATSGSGILQFNVGGGGDATDSEAMRIDSSGKVGIGTTSPLSALAVSRASGDTIVELNRSNTNVSGNVGCINFTASDGHSVGSIGMLGDGDDQGGDIVFRTTSAAADNSPFNAATPEVMRINSLGRVGIGEQSPAHKLHISADESTTIAYFDTALGGRGLKINTFVSGSAASAGVEFEAPAGANKSAFVFKGASEFMRIDTAGRLLIGTNSGTSHAISSTNNPKLQVESASSADYGRGSFVYNGNDGVGPGIYFAKSRGTSIGSNTIAANGDQAGGFFFHAADGTDKNSRVASIVCNIDGAPGSNDTPGRLVFNTTADGGSATTERMRIDSSGNILIGRTSAGNTGNGHTIRGSDSVILSRNATGETLQVCRNSNNGDFVQFRSGDSGNASSIGEISKSGGNVVYGGTSDYRLKENQVAISDGITRLKLLKPIRFNFKSHPSETVDGFFAHEVTPAVPEAVVGDKDDSSRMQSLDQSKLVPLLTAALQETIAKIETLETKVAALEAA